MSEIIDIKEIPEGTFPINLKLIKKYQQEEPSITAKYKDGMYHRDSLCEGSNININHLICKDSIVIPSKIQSYAVHLCLMYLLHPGMDRTERMI